MWKEELAERITQEATKLGFTNVLINPAMIVELNQASFIVQRNCKGLKLFAVWYQDKVFIFKMWSNGLQELVVMNNVILG